MTERQKQLREKYEKEKKVAWKGVAIWVTVITVYLNFIYYMLIKSASYKEILITIVTCIGMLWFTCNWSKKYKIFALFSLRKQIKLEFGLNENRFVEVIFKPRKQLKKYEGYKFQAICVKNCILICIEIPGRENWCITLSDWNKFDAKFIASETIPKFEVPDIVQDIYS